MSAASELFAKARAALLVGAPFWGVLSLRLAPIEDASVDTMETDGVSIRFNPAFVAGLSRGALRTVIAHETMHCAALHHTRRGDRDLRRWNIACDHAINPLLAAAGFELPDGALLDPAMPACRPRTSMPNFATMPARMAAATAETIQAAWAG